MVAEFIPCKNSGELKKTKEGDSGNTGASRPKGSLNSDIDHAKAHYNRRYHHCQEAASGVDNNKTNFETAKTYLQACMNQRSFGVLSEILYTSVFDVTQKTTKLITEDFRKEVEMGDIRGDFSFKYAADPSVQAYFITKFRDNSATSGTLGRGGNDWILMRYADIMLSLAEAHMNLGENAQAVALLDQVRSRAGLPSYATSMANSNYSSRFPTLKLALLHERRVELCFEHHRWHDLVRFFNPDELVAYFKTKNQADYNNSPLSNISTKDYYFPIPIDEVNINPNGMPQNRGY